MGQHKQKLVKNGNKSYNAKKKLCSSFHASWYWTKQMWMRKCEVKEERDRKSRLKVPMSFKPVSTFIPYLLADTPLLHLCRHMSRRAHTYLLCSCPPSFNALVPRLLCEIIASTHSVQLCRHSFFGICATSLPPRCKTDTLLKWPKARYCTLNAPSQPIERWLHPTPNLLGQVGLKTFGCAQKPRKMRKKTSFANCFQGIEKRRY